MTPRTRLVRPRLAAAIAFAVLAASGCASADTAPIAEPTTATVPTTTVAPAEPPSGPSTADCASGWTTPPADDPFLAEAIGLVQDQTSAPGPLVVVEARAFFGPDVPQIIEPRVENIPMMYVVAEVPGTEFSARFLVTRRSDERKGLEAVAPIGTHGFDGWVAFEGDGGPFTFDDIPGEWYGIRYDFVTGEGGSGFPGLDVTAIGCLSGT